jgi:aldehyde dehydrogenase (NAD+)
MWQPSWSCPTEGWFYPPTLLTNVSPSSTVAQEEIFGPVVALMTFRTPDEAVELANNSRYGLAASVWTENINTALDIAPRLQAGTVWVNCTNVFDAASGFGGYRESGFGREGGREGMWEYLKAGRRAGGRAGSDGRGADSAHASPPRSVSPPARPSAGEADGIDRTPKLYIGGKQARPDSGYSVAVHAPDGRHLGDVGRGNRKDVRNAVEAAHAAAGWSTVTAHLRAQVLYYVAENLAARAKEFAARLDDLAGSSGRGGAEVEASIQRLYDYAALADKWDGAVHRTPFRNVTLAMPEPFGVIGVVCPDEAPLLGLLSTVLPALCLGNRVVAIPSERAPLAATDLYQVLDTSDLPGGALNIITGPRDELAEVLASHDDVAAIWYFGPREGCAAVERASAGNMKRTWVSYGRSVDWFDAEEGAGEEFLREACQIKNIWVPYGA